MKHLVTLLLAVSVISLMPRGLNAQGMRALDASTSLEKRKMNARGLNMGNVPEGRNTLPHAVRITGAKMKRDMGVPKWLLSHSVQAYLPDTVVVFSSDSERYIYSYNSSGRTISTLTEQLENGKWTNYLSETRTYDANGNELTRADKSWENGQWANSDSSAFTYDAKGNVLTYSSEAWENNLLFGSFLETYSYGTNGLVDTVLEQEH
ncbi:MAG TPA: hypothetical protein VIS48_00380 [Candidatus Kryptonia bacterium]